jgi:ribonucleoside-diphosphate reductase alpha chain
MEFTSKDEIVCNLASLSLPMFVENGAFNHDLFYTVTKRVTRNLNKVIDRNYYPVKKEKTLINATVNWFRCARTC